MILVKQAGYYIDTCIVILYSNITFVLLANAAFTVIVYEAVTNLQKIGENDKGKN